MESVEMIISIYLVKKYGGKNICISLLNYIIKKKNKFS